MRMPTWGGRVSAAVQHSLCFGLFLVLTACGGGSGDQGPGTSPGGEQLAQRNYMPLNAGDRWAYRDTVTFEMSVVHVVGPATEGGSNGTLVRTVGYAAPDYSDVTETSESLYVASTTGLVEVPTSRSSPLAAAIGAIQRYRLPLRAGESFEQINKTLNNVVDVDGDGRGDTLRVRAVVPVVGLETVVVPAGTFEGCLHLRTVINESITLSSDGRTVDGVATGDEWLAPDIGLVRTDLRVESGTISEATGSVLHAYGVGGRRSESVPPTAHDTTPLADSTGMPQPVTVQLSERVDPESAQAAFKLADDQGRQLSGRVRQAVDQRLYFVPDQPLASGRYEARLSGTVVDPAGNALGADVAWYFTVDATAPKVVSITPGAGASRVPIDTVFTVRFSEPMSFNSTSDFRIINTSNGGEVGVQFEVNADTLIVRPMSVLVRGVEYSVTISPSIRDTSGNVLGEAITFSFMTDPGRFAPPELLMADTDYTALGDVNGDGRVDLLGLVRLPAEGSWATGLFVRYQLVDGTLGVATDTGWRGGFQPSCLASAPVIGDLNGDGRMDVVIGEGTCGVQVLLQAPDGRLVAGQHLPDIGSIRVVDFNGDGRQDLVGMSSPSELHVWQQSVSGTLTQQSDVATGVTEQLEGGFELGDLNGDDRIDLVIGTRVGGDYTVQQVVVLHQQPGGTFSPGVTYPVPVSKLAVGDLNNDGRADIAVIYEDRGNGTGVLGVMFQQTAGTLSPMQPSVIAQASERLKIADIDGDGRADIVVSHGSFGLGFLLQRPEGGWRAEEVFSAPPFSSSLQVGDLTGDGLADVVLSGTVLRQLPVTTQATAARRPGALAGAAVRATHSVGRATVSAISTK